MRTSLNCDSQHPGSGRHRDLLIADARGRPAAGAEAAVTALYQVHAVGLIRLAVVMLGDRPAAEDVVQEAFCGLYRNWARLTERRRR